MAFENDDDLSWPQTVRLLRREDLGVPATQVIGDTQAYLGENLDDIGRRVAPDQIELFVNGEAAPALAAEFQRQRPEFLALHDVGTSASLRLLGGLAGASGARVQKLSVRRQGHGVPLAVLQFVEVALADGPPLRIYATDLSADGQARTQLAQVLLGYSRLGVLLTGELPPHAMTAALLPLREAVSRGPWPNRDLLMLPLGSGTALAAQAAQLAAGGPVQVRVTPRAGKPKAAWGYIAGAWNRLHTGAADTRQVNADLARAVPRPPLPQSEAPTAPMGLDELPAPPATHGIRRGPVNRAPPAPGGLMSLRLDDPEEAAADDRAPMAAATRVATAAPSPSPSPLKMPVPEPVPLPVPGATRWQAYVERCAAIKGALAACVFDIHSLQALAHAGGNPGPERLARHGAQLLVAMSESARALGLSAGRTEAAVSSGQHHLLLRPVPGHPGIALHLVLHGASTNLTLARMQLERVEAPT